MKKSISLLIVTLFSVFVSIFISILSYAEAPSAKKSDKTFQVIVSGSACPQKQATPLDLTMDADHTQVPLDFEIELSGKAFGRKTCQARITIKSEPNIQYEVREVSQSLLFNVQKKSEIQAEISFSILGQQEFKIDQVIKQAGEYRHILVKKLINYATPCGKDSVLRIQTNIISKGDGKNNFKADSVALQIQKHVCEMPPTN